MESPRGRIQLMSMLQKGEIGPEDRVVEHLDSCLGCLGCQTACPSGVQYGKLLDQARPLLAEKRSPALRQLMRFSFSQLLPDYGRLRIMGNLLRLWQKTGANALLTRIPFAAPLLSKLVDMQDFLPQVPPFKPLPRQSWRSGEKSGEVQLFAGCVMDVFYNDVNHACIRLLTLQKQIVKVPEQTCCGALAFHAGEVDISKDLAKRNIEMFDGVKGDIVVTGAGCGAMLKEYGELLHGDAEWEERAHQFSSRVKDITEFLANHDFATPPQRIERRVAYHAACHLAHAQGIRQAPATLLEQIDGLELIPLEEAEHCCGSAGIYNLLHTDLSMEVLDRKMDNIINTGADELVTTNPGCLLQIQKGIRDRNVNIKASHLVELLDEAYRDPDT